MDEHDLFDDEQSAALEPADHAEVDDLLSSARAAAGQTFGPFNDLPDSPFYTAEELSPEETWERIAERVVLATCAAVVHGASGRPITVDAVRRLHEIIFVTTFPEHAGRLRQRGEEAQYGIVLGAAERPILQSARATAGARVLKRLDRACAEFNDAALAQDQRDAMQLEEVVLPAARLYVKVLSIHPFLDGNGRTAYGLLQYALVRSGLICVALEDFAAHQRALGIALRDDSRQSYLPLRDLLVDKLVRAKPQDNP